MTSINAVSTPAVEPRVFKRNGLVYANTRDLAVRYRRDHRELAQSIKQAIETSPDIFEFEISEDDAIEVVHRDSRGWTEVFFDLTYGAFLYFCREIGETRICRPSGFYMAPYEHAFIDKEKEIEKRKAGAEQVGTLAEQVNTLKIRSAYLVQDNIRLAQENADPAYRVRQLEIARGEEIEDAVSPSLFRN